jgi:hypothetical protein
MIAHIDFVPFPFLSSGWNVLDLVVVVVSLFSAVTKAFLETGKNGNSKALKDQNQSLKVLRILRAFRVVRVFKRLTALRQIIVALGASILPVLNECSTAFKASFQMLLSQISDQLDVTLESSKIVKLALTWVATTQSDANMSLFLFACLLNKWQSASSARGLQNKTRGLTTPRSVKPLSPNKADPIAQEIEVSQPCALPQHSCKTLCPGIADLIVAKIEVHQRCAVPKHFCKPHCPGWSDLIEFEIEVSQRCAL